MKKLKCSSCGGNLRIEDVPDQGLYGVCDHCGTRYAVQLINKKHVIVEHRFPGGVPPQASAAPLNPDAQRRLLIGIGIVGGGAAALGLIPTLFSSDGDRPAAAPTNAGGTVVWSMGEYGPNAGQFRGYADTIAIDGQDRFIVKTHNAPQVQIFNGDGGFLKAWPALSQVTKLYASFPSGEVLTNGNARIERRDFLTGQLIDTIALPDRTQTGIGISTPRYCVARADGSLIAYSYTDADREETGATVAVLADRLMLFRSSGRFDRVIGPLLGKVLQRDANIVRAPYPIAFAMDAAGNSYLRVSSFEDFETRTGIYVFNADGAFLRHHPTTSASGQMAVMGDGTLVYTDGNPMRIVRVKGSRTDAMRLDRLSMEGGWGSIATMALFSNGDVCVGTTTHRLARLRWDAHDA